LSQTTQKNISGKKQNIFFCSKNTFPVLKNAPSSQEKRINKKKRNLFLQNFERKKKVNPDS
jgi:hypothetical protein